MALHISSVETTDLFVGTADAPEQVVRISLTGADGPVTLTVTGIGVRSGSVRLDDSGVQIPAWPGHVGSAAEPVRPGPVYEVGLATTAPTGSELVITVTAALGAESVSAEATFVVAEPGWTMVMVSHFHYDPVWWNTQAAYTSPWGLLAADGTTRRLYEGNGFALVDAHLDLARQDPDYAFVLAEIDYLKPYFDTHPERRGELRELMAAGRVELVGGTYNEPNTNLTGSETTLRNLVYGIGYQRDILGGDPRTAWQLDVFGHDPQFPGYLAAAGLTGSAWARGPFHQWGPIDRNHGEAIDDATAMQFASEFEWIAPSGRGVLTHYMPHHYSAGWWMHASADLAEATSAVYRLFRQVKPVAATRNVLLPVGTDYTPPNRWVTQVHRYMAQHYVWPRFVCGTPRHFLDAVRAEFDERGLAPSPQSRDMNPIYTGKDVSYIDTKQAQRAAETAATDAEKLATAAGLLGLGDYPHAALDKVWRLLCFGAHHDGITGSECDQVYLDLLQNWREAYDLAGDVRNRSLAAVTARIDTSAGPAVVVTNTTGGSRTDLVEVVVAQDLITGPMTVVDDTGAPVPTVLRRAGEPGWALTFLARDVPGFGWRCWYLTAGRPSDWELAEGTSIGNEYYRVTVDPDRGGCVSELTRQGENILTEGGLGHELRLYEEYPAHPQMGEGPWHLLPSGPVTGSAAAPAASVTRWTSPLGERLVVTGSLPELTYEQHLTTYHGLDRVDLRTRVVDYSGADRLLRVRFQLPLQGRRPVSEVAAAVVGRGFALPDVDAADAPWTLDNPANTWFGLSSTARVDLLRPDGTPCGAQAFGVVEIVVPETGVDVRDLVVALARCGVTATTSTVQGSRYGWLHVDSNLPDLRILVGGPDENILTAELLGQTPTGPGPHFVAPTRSVPDSWVPNADLRDLRALPVLVVTDINSAVADLADFRITATTSSDQQDDLLTDTTAALISYGLPGFAIDPTGALHLSLFRSCTGWPSGIWLDPPRRTTPDGSGFQLQHWTHEFDYALVAGDGDWREQSLPAQGQAFSTPLLARAEPAHPGLLPATETLLGLAKDVLLQTFKPTGNPVAQGRSARPQARDGVTLRVAESLGRPAAPQPAGRLASSMWSAADVLEVPIGPAVDLEPFEVATLLGRGPSTAPSTDSGLLGLATEIARPGFNRYWLHNRGPAPMGFQPVSVSIDRALAIPENGRIAFTVTLASHYTDQEVEGVLDLVLPAGWTAEPAQRVFRLAAGGHLRVPVETTVPEPHENGITFVAARLSCGDDEIEDVMTVVLGDPGELVPDGQATPEPTREQGTDPAEPGRSTGLDVEVLTPELTVTPGAHVRIALTNHSLGEIRGEIALVSPWGTWDLFPDVLRGFRVAPQARIEIAFPAWPAPPGPTRQAWALAKVMWFGRVQYSEPITVRVGP